MRHVHNTVVQHVCAIAIATNSILGLKGAKGAEEGCQMTLVADTAYTELQFASMGDRQGHDTLCSCR